MVGGGEGAGGEGLTLRDRAGQGRQHGCVCGPRARGSVGWWMGLRGGGGAELLMGGAYAQTAMGQRAISRCVGVRPLAERGHGSRAAHETTPVWQYDNLPMVMMS